MFLKLGVCIFSFLCLISSTAFAEMDPITALRRDMMELKQMVVQLQSVVHQQAELIQSHELKIQRLEQPRLSASTPAVSPESHRTTPKWTPEIGVIADMVAKFDSPKVDEEGADRLSVRETELTFGSAVDPYSRLDATVALSDFEEASLEEAYLTHFGLPWNISGRFGKFKPKVGKALAVHRDSLDTVDEPLVISRYFGVEGMNKAGADFTRGLDGKWPLPQEVTFGVIEGGNGEEGTLFGESRRRPTIYTHFENYLEISDVNGMELGMSHLSGSRDEDPSLETQVIAADVTWIHRFNAMQRFKLQSETFFVHRQESNLDPVEFDDEGNPVHERINASPFGSYVLADLRLAQQWAAGYRFDHVEPIDNDFNNPYDEDIAHSVYLTFYQSEFARWRAQYTHVDTADGLHDNQVLLQGTFAIGEHKHKID